jgi:hypothetical protein
MDGLSDPFCNVLLAGRKVRTKTVVESLTPRWNETFVFSRHEPFGLWLAAQRHPATEADAPDDSDATIEFLVSPPTVAGETLSGSCSVAAAW